MGIAEELAQSTLTVSEPHLLDVGDWIVIGNWPRWMWRIHLPMFLRVLVRWIWLKLSGKRIGPSEPMRVTAITGKTVLTVGSAAQSPEHTEVQE